MSFILQIGSNRYGIFEEADAQTDTDVREQGNSDIRYISLYQFTEQLTLLLDKLGNYIILNH